MRAVTGRYFSGTIPAKSLVLSCQFDQSIFTYVCGQLERGRGGYLHWQLYIVTSRKSRQSALRKFLPGHFELTRSSAILEYVSKIDDTTVIGTFFECGIKPMSRNGTGGIDWLAIKKAAQSGDLESIPPYAYVSFYNSLKSIGRDHLQPIAIERTTNVFYGSTGTGKSHRAWAEAGPDAYPKDPNTKFWDGYRGQKHVIIDEFRGSISISHILRWLDKYPTIVEVKGSSMALRATTFWITSNLHPEDWYKDIDSETRAALLRRLNVEFFIIPFINNTSSL